MWTEKCFLFHNSNLLYYSINAFKNLLSINFEDVTFIFHIVLEFQSDNEIWSMSTNFCMSTLRFRIKSETTLFYSFNVKKIPFPIFHHTFRRKCKHSEGKHSVRIPQNSRSISQGNDAFPPRFAVYIINVSGVGKNGKC